MKKISIEELKRSVDEWVKLASSREPIIITDEGKPVAMLNGFGPSRPQVACLTGKIRSGNDLRSL
jgi:antitoxin (DNA-binding transcriptional repressor) of toxin-antitoxin stability system